MTKWLHLTERPEQFEHGLQAIASDDPGAFVDEGLLVYRYYDDEQVGQHQRDGRAAGQSISSATKHTSRSISRTRWATTQDRMSISSR